MLVAHLVGRRFQIAISEFFELEAICRVSTRKSSGANSSALHNRPCDRERYPPPEKVL